MARASRPQSADVKNPPGTTRGPPLLQLRRVERPASLGSTYQPTRRPTRTCSYEKLPTDIPSFYFPAKLTPSCLFRTVGCLVEPRERERGLEGPLKLFVADTIHRKFTSSTPLLPIPRPHSASSGAPPTAHGHRLPTSAPKLSPLGVPRTLPARITSTGR